MAAAVQLRSDYDGAALGKLARGSRDAKQVRRLDGSKTDGAERAEVIHSR